MFVDGKEVPYIKADYLFRAVYVPAGSHTVKMIFEPEVIAKGKTISLIAFGLFVLLSLVGIYFLIRKKEVLKTGVTIVQVPRGVNFGTVENPKIATMLFGIAGIKEEHLELIQKISIFCADVDNVVKLADAQTIEEIAKYFEN